MTRAYCPTPNDCRAPKRGVCSCQIDQVMATRERMKAMHADPEFKAKTRERMKAMNAARHIPVPDHLKNYAAKLRRNGIRGDALRKAIEAAQ